MMVAKFMPKLNQLFHADVTSVPVPKQRLLYEIVAICHRNAAEEIQRIIQQHTHVFELGEVVIDASNQEGTLTRVTVRVSSSIPERAELAKLVTRLGLEKAVRSVSWTGVIGKAQ